MPTAASATATTALRSTSETREAGRARTDGRSEDGSGSRITASAATVDATSAASTTSTRRPRGGVQRHRDAGVQPAAGDDVRRCRPRSPTPTGTARATTRNGSASANRSTWRRLCPRSLASATCVRRACAAVETSAKSSSRVSSTSGVRAATITRDSSVCSARTWSKTEPRSRSGSTSVCAAGGGVDGAVLKPRAACAARSIVPGRPPRCRRAGRAPTRKVCEVIEAGATSRAGAVGAAPVPRCGGTTQVVEPGEPGQVEPRRRARVGDRVGARRPVGHGAPLLGLDPAGYCLRAGAGRCRSRSRRTCRRRPARACGPWWPASAPRPWPAGTGPDRARSHMPSRQYVGTTYGCGPRLNCPPGPAPTAVPTTSSGATAGSANGAVARPPPGRRPPAPGRPPGRRAGRRVPSAPGTE